MAGKLTPTYQSVHNSPDLPYAIRLTATAICPKCQADANLGDLPNDGGLALNCPACGFSETRTGPNSKAVAEAAMRDALS
jgi:Zn ribbon nucleic-acid-binding protein